MRTKKQTQLGLQERRDASPVPNNSAEPLNAATSNRLSPDCYPEERYLPDEGKPNIGMKSRYDVWVLSVDGKPLTPTTHAKANRLMKGGVAKPVWNRFNTFGIQMLVKTGMKKPKTSLAIDFGTLYEGYTEVCGTENNLAVKWDLPIKSQIAEKMTMRRQLRHSRRHRNLRRRPMRPNCRVRIGFIAPSQAVVVGSRMKAIREFFRCYPISDVGIEIVNFDHSKNRFGANFSTMETGISQIRGFLKSQNVNVRDFTGPMTGELRKKYEYKKSSSKSVDKFESHCSDALAMAGEVGPGVRVEPGRFIVVDDTYRPVRRQLHHTQPPKGGIRKNRSKGTVRGFRKGLLIGRPDGQIGRLCGEYKGKYRYLDSKGTRQATKNLAFACGHFITRPGLVSAFAERKRA